MIVSWETPQCFAQAQELSKTLALSLNKNSGLDLTLPAQLYFTEQKLVLMMSFEGEYFPLSVDLCDKSLRFRLAKIGIHRELIAKAVGLKSGYRPHIVDGTAGLGKDAAILAALGCRCDMIERSPIMASLLQDGLNRAKHVPEPQPWVERLTLTQGDVRLLLPTVIKKPEVVYLDPMYPEKIKSALVKIEMRLMQQLLGFQDDSDLLEIACTHAQKRVVVKRPLRGPTLIGRRPDYSLKGSSSRFDVYLMS